MTDSYDDIINLPHHVSQTHPQMSQHDRAAQFSPFAALVGYEAAISETARTTEPRLELDEQELTLLNRKLAMLRANLEKQPLVTIRYFIPDKRKDGGKYETVTGIVRGISPVGQTITLQSGQEIKTADVFSLDSDFFEDNEKTMTEEGADAPSQLF